jgi:hypothetical protein
MRQVSRDRFQETGFKRAITEDQTGLEGILAAISEVVCEQRRCDCTSESTADSNFVPQMGKLAIIVPEILRKALGKAEPFSLNYFS